MDPNLAAIERAFQAAKSDEAESVVDLRDKRLFQIKESVNARYDMESRLVWPIAAVCFMQQSS
jgi:hypothetical protein